MERDKKYLLDYAERLFIGQNRGGDASYVRHIDGEILYVSGGMCELLGDTQSQEIIGENIFDLFTKFTNYSYADLKENAYPLQKVRYSDVKV